MPRVSALLRLLSAAGLLSLPLSCATAESDDAGVDVVGFDARRDGAVGSDARPEASSDATGCRAAADCTDPGRPICDGATGRCLPCDSANDQCPAGRYCSGGQCVSGCRTDADCAGDGTSGHCNVAMHVCVQCARSEDCPAGNVCNTGRCVTGCDPAAGASCPRGQQCCSGGCVDTQANPTNCGSCGMPCSVANGMPGCAMGMCTVAACTAPFADCDRRATNGCEADTSQDVANCGSCGNACAARANARATCAMGQCGFACNAGYADCDGNPANGCETDTRASATNCGACGTSCTIPNGTAACVAGRCQLGMCQTGFGDCDRDVRNGCETDVTSSLANCGACGAVCGDSPNATGVCSRGACVPVCNAGFSNCDGNNVNGCEVASQTDVANCGSCGRRCTFANAAATCSAGTCNLGACTAGFGNCDGNASNGCEANLGSDPNNCMSCGRACMVSGGTAVCAAGTCTVGACTPPFGNCDGSGCNTDTRFNVNNCGSCGRVCSFANASALCNNSVCALGACSPGYGDCNASATDGCESPLLSDPNNCGSCGRRCTISNGTPFCASGSCGVATCNPGYSDCDGNVTNGCETITSVDVNNCGACGRACSLPNATATCSSGSCAVASCLGGFGDCNGTPGDGCEAALNTTSNCGACGVVCATGQSCVGGACSAAAPANDQCAGAQMLTLSTSLVSVTGTNAGATNQAGCGSGGDVYYRFHLSQREVVMVEVLASGGWDPTVAIATGCTGNTACNDDASDSDGARCAGVNSMLVQVLAAGDYYIAVGAFSGSGGFTLNVHHLPAASGTVGVLSRTLHSVAGSTTGTGAVVPGCGNFGANAGESMYYFTTCPSYGMGAWNFGTCSSGGSATWDTVVYFRQSNAAEVCNDDDSTCGLQSSISGNASGGAALRAVYVDGYNGATGSFTLGYTVPAS